MMLNNGRPFCLKMDRALILGNKSYNIFFRHFSQTIWLLLKFLRCLFCMFSSLSVLVVFIHSKILFRILSYVFLCYWDSLITFVPTYVVSCSITSIYIQRKTNGVTTLFKWIIHMNMLRHHDAAYSNLFCIRNISTVMI